jgi:hypothetical protein
VAVAQLRLVRRIKPRRVFAAVLLLLAVGFLFAFAYGSYARNPLTRPKSEVRAWLLGKTPIGSSREQIMATIEREHWEGHPEYRGEFHPEVDLAARRLHRQYPGYGAELGPYYFPPFYFWPCHASAYWLFGADDRVTDVFVSKWCEGL